MTIFMGKIGDDKPKETRDCKDTREMASHEQLTLVLRRKENSTLQSKGSEPWKWQHLAVCPFVKQRSVTMFL